MYLLFGLIGHFGLLKDVNISLFLSALERQTSFRICVSMQQVIRLYTNTRLGNIAATDGFRLHMLIYLCNRNKHVKHSDHSILYSGEMYAGTYDRHGILTLEYNIVFNKLHVTTYATLKVSSGIYK